MNEGSVERDRERDRKNRKRDHKRRDESTSRESWKARSADRRTDERRRDRSVDKGPTEEESEQEKKRKRLEKLAAWRNKAGGAPAQQPGTVKVEPSVKAEEPQAWMPWEDPATAFTGALPKPPPLTAAAPATQLPPSAEEDSGIDPLDAFMAAEINPEVVAKEREEARKREEDRLQKAQQRAEGKLPKLEAILEDSDDEEQPDMEIQIPEHKVKLVVGAGGEKIKFIQKKSKCRLQIKKEEDELSKGFGMGGKSYALPKARQVGDPVKLTTIMLFGNAKECDIAQRMIEEAIENKEQKQKQRQRDYDRKKDAKLRERQLYHLRHTHDYEALELPMGASKADAKTAYRRLAKIWHPDKHPNNQEEAKEKFQAIQKAFDSLMSTDEDTRVEALAH